MEECKMGQWLGVHGSKFFWLLGKPRIPHGRESIA
jgi:hypothetical protein